MCGFKSRSGYGDSRMKEYYQRSVRLSFAEITSKKEYELDLFYQEQIKSMEYFMELGWNNPELKPQIKGENNLIGKKHYGPLRDKTWINTRALLSAGTEVGGLLKAARRKKQIDHKCKEGKINTKYRNEIKKKVLTRDQKRQLKQLWVDKKNKGKKIIYYKDLYHKLDNFTEDQKKRIKSLLRQTEQEVKEISVKVHKPSVPNNKMCLSGCQLLPAKNTSKFDFWLKILHGTKQHFGRYLLLPIKAHEHFNKWSRIPLSKMATSFNIFPQEKRVEVTFKIPYFPPENTGDIIGVDVGIKNLFGTYDGKQENVIGKGDLNELVEKEIRQRASHAKRRKGRKFHKGVKLGCISKANLRLRRRMKHYFDTEVRELVRPANVYVVEDLRGLGSNTRGKMNKKTRRKLSSWCYSYLLNRIGLTCEERRAGFNMVNSAYTSQMCPACKHTERSNRSGDVFRCRKCGFSGHADIVGAKNIRSRFIGLGRLPSPGRLNP